MEKVALFQKVSFENFAQAYSEVLPSTDEEIRKVYEALPLPVRATSGSAGYDFCSPFEFSLEPGEEVKIPTGIRARIKDGWVLQIFPRSGLGFKFRLQLNNTVGIIDSDYYGSDNEGHIFIKLTNDSKTGSAVKIEKFKAFAQGIFLPFGITEDDECINVRNGGFGSSGK